IAILNLNVFPLNITELSQPSPECAQTRFSGGIAARHISYPRDFRRLLRLGEVDQAESEPDQEDYHGFYSHTRLFTAVHRRLSRHLSLVIFSFANRCMSCSAKLVSLSPIHVLRFGEPLRSAPVLVLQPLKEAPSDGCRFRREGFVVVLASKREFDGEDTALLSLRPENQCHRAHRRRATVESFGKMEQWSCKDAF